MIAWARVDSEGRLEHGLMHPRVGLLVRRCGELSQSKITDVNLLAGTMSVARAEAEDSDCRIVPIDIDWIAIADLGWVEAESHPSKSRPFPEMYITSSWEDRA